jgi:alanine-glyoxylate transaminase/(R)-3-amino-2-methylpropionate-pyruvate transaminase
MPDPSATCRQASLPPTAFVPAPYDGPSRDEVLALRKKYLMPGILTYYQEPLLIAQGHMQYVWDEKGRRYLDAFAGVVTVSVGHCHPHVVERVREQVGKLQHTTTLYIHPHVGRLAQKLAQKMPAGKGLENTYFTNSGSEANEIAILTAREHTGNAEVISLRGSYHGGTQGTMGLVAVGTWKYKSNPSVDV